MTEALATPCVECLGHHQRSLVRRVTFPKPGWGPAGSGSTPDIRPWTEWFVPFPSYRGA